MDILDTAHHITHKHVARHARAKRYHRLWISGERVFKFSARETDAQPPARFSTSIDTRLRDRGYSLDPLSAGRSHKSTGNHQETSASCRQSIKTTIRAWVSSSAKCLCTLGKLAA